MLSSENNTLDKRPNTNSDQHTIIYLACPYTHPDPSVREKRFRLATDAAAELIRQGYIVYSAITMTHPLDVVLAGDTNTLGSDYWVQFDEAFMAVCAEMVVLQIEGWEQSRGIQREIGYFQSRGKPVRFLPAKGAEIKRSWPKGGSDGDDTAKRMTLEL